MMQKRDLCILMVVIAVAIGLGIFILSNESIATGAWGLSFSTEGAAPAAPMKQSQLWQYGGTYIGDTSQKVLYLTFDAGYENGCTAEILDVLKKHQVPAAFFLVGNYLQQNKDLVRRMVQEGHIVGNHTMHHPDMSKIVDPEAFRKELEDLEKLYLEITGQEMEKFYRPPQGLYSEENLQLAQKLGYKTVFWSLAYMDWDNQKQPSAEYAFGKLLPRTHNGAVILLHSTSKTNAAILDELLTRWKAMGYTFGTLQDLFGM